MNGSSRSVGFALGFCLFAVFVCCFAADVAVAPSTFTGLFYLDAGWGDDVITIGGAGVNDTANFSVALLQSGFGVPNVTVDPSTTGLVVQLFF